MDMEGCIWYLNNILFYGGNTEAEHQGIVSNVLQQYIKHGVTVNVLESEFHFKETIFLVHKIKGEEVKMDPATLETMCKWSIIKKKKEVQAFVAVANY